MNARRKAGGVLIGQILLPRRYLSEKARVLAIPVGHALIAPDLVADDVERLKPFCRKKRSPIFAPILIHVPSARLKWRRSREEDKVAVLCEAIDKGLG